MNSKQLVEAFNTCFLSSFNTCLIGGADEPLYRPADESSSAVIYFRLDYPSSALHEISHWCIAGQKRRELEDYGYWYEPDSRNAQAQGEFEAVEVKPQAVECILHWVAGLAFRVSVDNLAMPDYDPQHFERAVKVQVGKYLISNLPKRALIFSKHLLAQRCPDLIFEEFLQQCYENYCR
ncbi:elongation factor P hydroxylase [Marinomonas transparens]|uniref:elongation factor P hydroxylase n=1 Tax=Marinomonas transparens TaxID=2795388 RepID=UPI002D804D22|nr:elongation factor P hydroxylase [Marinomonas transparens]